MASISSPRPSCEKVGSSARNAVTWVSANTKTRSKNSSSGETLASRGSARIRRPRGRSSSRVALIVPDSLSVEEDRDLLDGRALGHALLLARVAEVQQADRQLVVRAGSWPRGRPGVSRTGIVRQ